MPGGQGSGPEKAIAHQTSNGQDRGDPVTKVMPTNTPVEELGERVFGPDDQQFEIRRLDLSRIRRYELSGDGKTKQQVFENDLMNRIQGMMFRNALRGGGTRRHDYDMAEETRLELLIGIGTRYRPDALGARQPSRMITSVAVYRQMGRGLLIYDFDYSHLGDGAKLLAQLIENAQAHQLNIDIKQYEEGSVRFLLSRINELKMRRALVEYDPRRLEKPYTRPEILQLEKEIRGLEGKFNDQFLQNLYDQLDAEKKAENPLAGQENRIQILENLASDVKFHRDIADWIDGQMMTMTSSGFIPNQVTKMVGRASDAQKLILAAIQAEEQRAKADGGPSPIKLVGIDPGGSKTYEGVIQLPLQPLDLRLKVRWVKSPGGRTYYLEDGKIVPPGQKDVQLPQRPPFPTPIWQFDPVEPAPDDSPQTEDENLEEDAKYADEFDAWRDRNQLGPAEDDLLPTALVKQFPSVGAARQLISEAIVRKLKSPPDPTDPGAIKLVGMDTGNSRVYEGVVEVPIQGAGVRSIKARWVAPPDGDGFHLEYGQVLDPGEEDVKLPHRENPPDGTGFRVLPWDEGEIGPLDD